MAYPANKLPPPQTPSVLFDEEKLARLVDLFPQDEHDIERLRFHYMEEITPEEEIEEPQKKPVEADKVSELPSPAPTAPVELMRGENIDTVGLYLKEMSQVPLLNNKE